MATYQSSNVAAGNNATAAQYNNLRADAITAQNIKSGLDAAKSATPAVGDIYYATDTKKLYHCGVVNVWESGFGAGMTASNDLLVSADTERTGNTEAYVMKKQIRVPAGGYFRIKFDIRSDQAGRVMYGRIYVNGIAVGTEQSCNTTEYVNKSEDIGGISAGSLVQLYVKTNVAGNLIYCRNFRIYGIPTTTFTVITD